jgi:hypothetical protein
MPTNHTASPTLQDHLTEPLRLGDPDVHGSLVVFPVFGPEPRAAYVSFAQGRARGAAIKELEQRAAVNDLLVLNPTDDAILLYEGEEVLGAQQNRTFDVSVMVGARSQLVVPVSCVEAARWDDGRHDESFAPAPQAAYPALRAMKNRAARASLVSGVVPRAMQQEVWSEVAEKSERMDVHSHTSAMHDIYDRRRAALDEFLAAIGLHDGQTGALALIGGRPTVLDHVSRPDVFAALHAPLVQGYALDALEISAGGDAPARPGTATAQSFLRHVLRARVSEHDGIGLGRDLRFAQARVAGAGLVVGDELVQLTAFADDAPGAANDELAAGRIRRPSRRRTA